MECRIGCGACCIAPSISSAIPEMPQGKTAGERCVQLTDDNLCKLFGLNSRPSVCLGFKAEPLFCGTCFEEAMTIIGNLEACCTKKQ